MGGSSTSTKHETSSNTINPYQMAQYQQNYAGAQDRFGSLQPYTGPLTAGFNPTQLQAQNTLTGIATDPRYAAANQNAMDQVKGVLGSIPTGQINASPITASTYDAAQLAGTDLSPYYNPFQKQVIDASIAQNQYARDQQAVNDNATATAAHAFGGSRQGVQRAETTAGYDRNNQQNIAALNQANFAQAQNAALSDIGARNQAGQFNAGQRQAAGIFNSGQDLTAQQNTFANALSSLGLRMNAAGQLQQMSAGDLARATQQAGILSAVGDTQQQQEQRGYTDQYDYNTQLFNRALAQQQALNQALGIIPLEQTKTTDGTTTTKQNPGALGIMSGIAGLGLAAATGGSSLGLTSALGGAGGIGGMFSMGGLLGPKYTGNGNGEFY